MSTLIAIGAGIAVITGIWSRLSVSVEQQVRQ